MSSRNTRYEGTEQLKGMSDRRRAEPDQPELLENVYLDPDGTWRTSGGYEQVTTNEWQREVLGVHWFAQHQGGRQWLLAEYIVGASVVVGYIDFTIDNAVALESGRTHVPGPRPGSTFFDSGDWCYVLNGYNPPSRWNGREYVKVGFTTKPPSPTVSIAAYDNGDKNHAAASPNNTFQRGVGSEFDSNDKSASRFLYGYAIQWVNDRGMSSPASEIVWINGQNEDPTPSSGKVGVRSINVTLPEAPDNVRAVRVLRTVNLWGGAATTAAPLYEIASFPTGGRVAFADDTPDFELVLRYDPYHHGLWPLKARYAAMFKGVLFVDEGDRLRYSVPGFIEQMPEQNNLLLGSDSSGPIMGMKAARNVLIVWKRRGLYMVRGNPLDGFQVDTLDGDLGCTSPRAIIEVPGQGTLFLSDDGPYLLSSAIEDGAPTKPIYIGGPISKTWRKQVNRKALVAARAGRNLADREVWFQVPEYGNDRPSLGLVYHFDVGGWSLRTGFSASCFTDSRDHRSLLFFGSWDTTSNIRGIHVYTRGSDQNGTAVSSTVNSAWLRTGIRQSLPYRVEVLGLNTGRDVTLKSRVDRANSFSGASDTTHEQKDYERERPVWGTAVWDTDDWQPFVPITLPTDFHEDVAREFQWQIVGEKLAVFGFVAHFRQPSNFDKRGAVV
jgi:hypothetical protein